MRSDLPNTTHLFISHDGLHSEMERVTASLQKRFPFLSKVVHPYSCRRRAGFPSQDRNGKEIPDWQATCAKNHWLWAMARAWRRYPSLQWLLYLEEDFLVPKHLFALQSQLAVQAQGSDFLGSMLDRKSVV